MTNNKIAELETNLFEDLNDEQLQTVVGGTGTVGQTVVATGNSFGDIGRGFDILIAASDQGGAEIGRTLKNDLTQTGQQIPA